jgi:hypothetical protein
MTASEKRKAALQEEIVESRERVVVLITQKNRLRLAAQAGEEDPEIFEELERLESAVAVWRQILAQREAEIREMTAELLFDDVAPGHREEARSIADHLVQITRDLEKLPRGDVGQPALRAEADACVKRLRAFKQE